MQILMLLLVIMISSCASIKYSHDYFLNVRINIIFKSLSSCAFEEIKKYYEDKQIVNLKKKDSWLLKDFNLWLCEEFLIMKQCLDI